MPRQFWTQFRENATGHRRPKMKTKCPQVAII